MKVFKVALLIIGIVLIVAVAAVAYLANNLDGIVKRVVESEGPKITQTAVTLADVDIQLRQGRGELTNFRIANPPDYDTSDAVLAEQLVLDIEPSSVTGDVIVVNEIVVQGVTVTAEQKGMTTNLQDLLKAVQEAAGEGEASEGESDLRLMVEKVRFADSRVQLVTEQHGDYPVNLPAFELTDLGDRERGLTPAELGKAMLQPLITQARQAAQKRLQELARDRAEGELKDRAKEKLGEDAEEKINRLRGILN